MRFVEGVSRMELTTEQKFEMRRIAIDIQNLSREDAIALLLDATKLLMLKDNVIKGLQK